MEENGKLLRFVYHKGELVYERGEKEQTGTSYHQGAGTEALNRAGKIYYYHKDEQLSTAFITDEQGAIKNTYRYDAFGNTLDSMEQIENRIRYIGQQYDGITGQYYLRARYYNPAVGRFMQEDTYRGDGLNLYAYCANNPVTYYDPSGYAGTSSYVAADGGDGGEGTPRSNKPVNRPSSKKVGIDMDEVLSGHTSGGQRAQQSEIKDLFPDRMDADAIEKEIRMAYSNAKQVGSPQFDGVDTRIKLQGEGMNGVVEMWYNKTTKTIETAYPIYGKKVKIN